MVTWFGSDAVGLALAALGYDRLRSVSTLSAAERLAFDAVLDAAIRVLNVR
jgi:hypothetical protein